MVNIGVVSVIAGSSELLEVLGSNFKDKNSKKCNFQPNIIPPKIKSHFPARIPLFGGPEI